MDSFLNTLWLSTSTCQVDAGSELKALALRGPAATVADVNASCVQLSPSSLSIPEPEISFCCAVRSGSTALAEVQAMAADLRPWCPDALACSLGRTF